jgi:fatty acid desaturase
MNNNYWNIYGNKYDLTTFLDKHPGGKHILKNVRGDSDLTPLFESYHAFANIEQIKKQLAVYKLNEKGVDQIYTFNNNDFYNTVKNRVRASFGNDKSLTNKIKVTNFWYFKIFILLSSFLFLYSTAFLFQGLFYIKLISGFLAGLIYIMLGFTVMHDASHYALYNKSNQINIIFSKIWNSFALWDYDLWFRHHGHYHHAYTGSKLDPDLKFMKPLLIKHPLTSKKGYSEFTNNYLLLFLSLIYFFIFPGFFLGQGMLYWLVWKRRGILWNLEKPEISYSFLKVFFVILFIGTQLYNFNIFVSLLYLIAGNIAYGCSILPDHDTFETTKNKTKTKDWGEAQVVHSANFENGRIFDLYCHLFGGINYQIEHHLFPSICHVHYPKIAPIVKQTCKEFNIKYVEHKSVFTAMKDVFKSLIKLNNYKGSN